MERRPEVRVELGNVTGDAGLDLTGGCRALLSRLPMTPVQLKCCNLKLGCRINAGLDDWHMWQMWQMNSKTFVTSVSWGFRVHLP